MPKIATTPGCFCCGTPLGPWGCRGAGQLGMNTLVGWLRVHSGQTSPVGTYSSTSVPSVPHFHKSYASCMSLFPSSLLLVPWLIAYLETSLTELFRNDGGWRVNMEWKSCRGGCTGGEGSRLPPHRMEHLTAASLSQIKMICICPGSVPGPVWWHCCFPRQHCPSCNSHHPVPAPWPLLSYLQPTSLRKQQKGKGKRRR